MVAQNQKLEKDMSGKKALQESKNKTTNLTFI